MAETAASHTVPAARAVGFIRFHGLTLLVVAHEGVEYVPAKPFAELAGVDWKGAKRALSSGDSAVLYGTRAFLPPEIRGAGGDITPRNAVLYLRLDRARMYLARINTDRMRSHGNASGADHLLALQIEWAEALHAYETHGVAIKAGRAGAVRELHQLARTRMLVTDPRERRALTALLHAELRALGLPVDSFDDPQGQLPLDPAVEGARHA